MNYHYQGWRIHTAWYLFHCVYVRSTAWFCFVKRLRHLGSTCNPMLSAMRIAAIVFPSRFKHIDSLREKNILGRFGSGWMDFHLLTQHTHFKSFWAKPIDGYSKWHHVGFKFNFDTKGEKRRLTLRPGAPRSPFSPDFPGSPWREEKHVNLIIQVNGDKTSLQCVSLLVQPPSPLALLVRVSSAIDTITLNSLIVSYSRVGDNHDQYVCGAMWMHFRFSV